jgi:molecular chaperone GrpE
MAENDNSDQVEPEESELMQDSGPDNDLSDLYKQLEEAQGLAEERLEQLMRCRADLDNTMKIVTREKEEHARFASEKLISKLLCVLDSLDQASKHDEGSKVLYQQLLDILKGEGLEPIDAIGKKFNPFKHEALMQVKSEELEEDSVVQEIQRGYSLNSRVIRFSKVAVAKR